MSKSKKGSFVNKHWLDRGDLAVLRVWIRTVKRLFKDASHSRGERGQKNMYSLIPSRLEAVTSVLLEVNKD